MENKKRSKMLPLALLGVGLSLLGAPKISAQGLEQKVLPRMGYPKVELSHLNNAVMLIQNSSLIYEDIYTYTKPAIEKFGLTELNPIPKALQEKNLWEVDCVYSIGLPILGNLIAYQIDKTGNLAKIINGVTAAVQVFAIQNNSKLLMARGWKENSSNIKRYVEIFRINY